MMDLGCHSVYIANWLFGDPKRVAAIYNTLDNRPVDDNAMMSVEYHNQVVAILETSFVSFRSPRMIEVYGDQGAIQWTGQELQMISTVQPGFEDWQTVTDLPSAVPTPVEQFIAAILEDDDRHIFCGLEMGVALSNVLEKSYLSNQHNQIVTF